MLQENYLTNTDFNGIGLNQLDMLENTRISLPEELLIETTTDMQYLQQYYFIREYIYKNYLRVETFSGEEDEIDRKSYLIVARKGHFCIGGARLTISTIENRRRLPLERFDFNLTEHLPFIQHSNYCELGRVAVLPQYRQVPVIAQISKYAVEIALQHQCNIMFGVSSPPLARIFRNLFRNMGLREEIRAEIPVPMGTENSHLKLVLQILHLKENEHAIS